jgi:hypothetical protein
MLSRTLHLSAAALLGAALLWPGTSRAAADELPRGPVSALVDLVPVVAEHERAGYSRTSFRHWTDADGDGCPTRAEVLKEESEVPVTQGAACRITAARWTSYYDGKVFESPARIDIDHLVPLAEAFDSGAWAWSAAEREAYANDLSDSRHLVAVSAAQNRAKADRDPAQWMPAEAGAACRYVSEWTAVKLRWALSADVAEAAALAQIAAGCPADVVEVEGDRRPGAVS